VVSTVIHKFLELCCEHHSALQKGEVKRMFEDMKKLYDDFIKDAEEFIQKQKKESERKENVK
jgi:hypothetical protein